MPSSPAALRQLAEAYRSIALDIGTQEVRDSLRGLAAQFDRRAELWSILDAPVEEPPRRKVERAAATIL